MPIMRLLAILLAASSSLSFRCRATLSLFWLCWMRNTDRKSTRLNSSHGYISYAVFCLKKKTEIAMVKFKRTVLVCVLLIASSLAQGPTTFHPGFNFFSRQQDVQLGQESAAQVRRQMQMVKDPFLNDYVNRVGRKLANAPEARASGFPFTFEVVADRSINAFALPGGPMFINTGLLKAVDNEAPLAGVTGHEMSHAILRHGTNQASKAQAIQLPLMLGSRVAGGSMLGRLGHLGIGLGA